MELVIVESPTKAKTISKFLGKKYKVLSSYGHIRDLPRSKLGIDVEHDFDVQYLIPKKSRENVKELRKAAVSADGLILATDEDREGEAIAWHLREALTAEKKTTPAKERAIKNKPFRRIVFHEITESAIEEAIKSPRDIDMNLVNAQQARRALDRIVGYKLSPFLWKKLMGGLSAGRVQSVALRLIAEREEEIKKFKPEIYFSVAAELENGAVTDLQKINGESLPELGIRDEGEARRIAEELQKAKARLALLQKKETAKNPLPPFITSTLQQAAATRLGFSAKKTMMFAQRLYEHGHITYMRTDSVNLSQDSLRAAKTFIEKSLGAPYATEAPRVFKKKSRLAQEAHEAIRPTKPSFVPKSFGGEAAFGSKEEEKLYELIWRRFIASQMPKAQFDATRAEFEAQGTGGTYLLVANGNVLKFDGFLKVWPRKFSERELPPELAEGTTYDIKNAESTRHETEPPPRYGEASLIKTLEKFGIGRPSTYAPTISTIMARNYVEKMAGKFHPTETGTLVNSMLTEHFPQIVDIDFTAKMEEALDKIAEGDEDWRELLRQFYGPFNEHLEKKYKEVEKEEVTETTDEVCEKCGKPMQIKRGRFGKFLACTGYPECKNTKSLKDAPKEIGMKCPTCSVGEVVEKRVNKGRAKGKMFWGCSRYPDCDFASWKNPKEENKEEDKKEDKVEDKKE